MQHDHRMPSRLRWELAAYAVAFVAIGGLLLGAIARSAGLF